MKESKTYLFIEYLSLILIISYFFIHNILLVLIGITFSLYLININFFSRLIKPKNLKNINKKDSYNFNQDKVLKRSNPVNIESNKEKRNLSLVEKIEELGFIPSINEENDTDAA